MATNINKPCLKNLAKPKEKNAMENEPPKEKNAMENEPPKRDKNVNNKNTKKAPDEMREKARSAILKYRGKIMTESDKKIKECSFGTYWKYCMKCNPELRKKGNFDDIRNCTEKDNVNDVRNCTEKDLRDGLILKMEYIKNRKTNYKNEEIMKEKVIKGIPQHYNVWKYRSENYKLKQEKIANVTQMTSTNELSNTRKNKLMSKSEIFAKFNIKNDSSSYDVAGVKHLALNETAIISNKYQLVKPFKLDEKDSIKEKENIDKLVKLFKLDEKDSIKEKENIDQLVKPFKLDEKDSIKEKENIDRPSERLNVVKTEEENTSMNISNNKITSFNANSLDEKPPISQFENQESSINHKASSASKNLTEIKDIASKSIQDIQLSQSLKYPKVGEEDFKCLPEGKLINDTIIEFYLKYIFNEKLSLDVKMKTYICSQFTYTKWRKEQEMMAKKGAIPDVTVVEWLKDADLFSKDFIVIPINIKDTHWYLVMICFLSELCNIPLDDSGTETKASRIQSKFQKMPKDDLLSSKQPCLCFFDSFDAKVHLDDEKLKVTKDLMNLLKALRLRTHKNDKVCNWRELIPLKVLCLQQSDNYNCGIFLLQYVESFFEAPIVTNKEGYPSAEHWFDNSIIANKREKIKKLIEEKQGK